jgi:hypothetical protein
VNFLNYIAKEEEIEFGEKIYWRLEVTPAPIRLVLHNWRIEDGEQKNPWCSSVLVSDIDPQSVTVEEPLDKGELYRLKLRCHFYRDAISERCEYNSAFNRRSVVLHLSIATDVADVGFVKESLQKFLAANGARPAILQRDAAVDLLKPVKLALEPALRTKIHSRDKKTTFRQTVTVNGETIQIIRTMKRFAGRKSIPFWELPMRFWKVRKQLTPAIETDTFELLSMDTTKGDVRKVPEEENVWIASLYSVARLDTRLCQNSANHIFRMWYLGVLFPTEAEADHFVKTCAIAVDGIRERFSGLHQQ